MRQIPMRRIKKPAEKAGLIERYLKAIALRLFKNAFKRQVS